MQTCFIFSTYPPFKLNGFDTTGPSGGYSWLSGFPYQTVRRYQRRVDGASLLEGKIKSVFSPSRVRWLHFVWTNVSENGRRQQDWKLRSRPTKSSGEIRLRKLVGRQNDQMSYHKQPTWRPAAININNVYWQKEFTHLISYCYIGDVFAKRDWPMYDRIQINAMFPGGEQVKDCCPPRTRQKLCNLPAD